MPLLVNPHATGLRGWVGQPLEATGQSGEEFGLDQLEALLKEHSSLPLPFIVQEIQSKLKSYHQDDDQSLLLVRLQGLDRNLLSWSHLSCHWLYATYND